VRARPLQLEVTPALTVAQRAAAWREVDGIVVIPSQETALFVAGRVVLFVAIVVVARWTSIEGRAATALHGGAAGAGRLRGRWQRRRWLRRRRIGAVAELTERAG
jgi:hypothetical protein